MDAIFHVRQKLLAFHDGGAAYRAKGAMHFLSGTYTQVLLEGLPLKLCCFTTVGTIYKVKFACALVPNQLSNLACPFAAILCLSTLNL